MKRKTEMTGDSRVMLSSMAEWNDDVKDELAVMLADVSCSSICCVFFPQCSSSLRNLSLLLLLYHQLQKTAPALLLDQDERRRRFAWNHRRTTSESSSRESCTMTRPWSGERSLRSAEEYYPSTPHFKKDVQKKVHRRFCE